MPDPTKQIVYNHDIIGFQTRINRFINELIKSQSSNVSQMNSFDQDRLQTYLKNIRAFHAWVTAQPQLDLPETNPTPWALEPNPETPDVENEEINDIVRMFGLARDELINSQSARVSSGLIKFDSTRFIAIVGKVETFLANFVAQVTPIDLPESSPQDPMAPTGLRGV